MAKITTPDSLYGNSRDILREAERENEILADIAGEEYESPGDIPKGKYVIEKRLLDAAQKKNELLESIAEGGGGGGGGAAKAIGIDYATDVISLKNKDGETITGSGATLPAYGVSFDPTTGGLTLTKNGTAVQGQTVTIPNYGSPVGVTDSADMVDEGTIYLYEGTTGGGFTNGHFYYYDGSAWADGGEYAAATVQTDKTLLVEDRAADAKATGEAVGELKTQLNQRGIPSGGSTGQSLRKKSGTNYDMEWADVGLPTDEQTADAVSAWLDDHPEATTTVEDHSLTYEKLVNGTLGFVTPEMFGAKGDGQTDDTDAIKAAVMHGGYVLFRNTTYRFHAASGGNATFPVPSNTVINLNGATLEMDTNDINGYTVFNAYGNYSDNSWAENIAIIGPGTICGDRENHTIVANQQGGSLIRANRRSRNIYIDNLILKQCYGDGIYIGPGGETDDTTYIKPDNIHITNCRCCYNRRNGISIISGTNIFIDNVECDHNIDQNTQAGLDIEPNYSSDVVSVFIGTIHIHDNGRRTSLSNHVSAQNLNVYIDNLILVHDSLLLKTDNIATNVVRINNLHIIYPTKDRALELTGPSVKYLGNVSICVDLNYIPLNDDGTEMSNPDLLIYCDTTKGESNADIGMMTIAGDSSKTYGLITNANTIKVGIGTINIDKININTALNYSDIQTNSLIRSKALIKTEDYTMKLGDTFAVFTSDATANHNFKFDRNPAINGQIVTLINQSAYNQFYRGANASTTIVQKDGTSTTTGQVSIASGAIRRFVYSQTNSTFYEV